MIRPSNINIANHTADFKCDQHGGSVSGLNLNTEATYFMENSVAVSGANLTPPCDCISCFPTANGNADAQAIAQAKTE
jgi:hypothetical protein